MANLKSISMELDRDWLLASLNASTGASFTLERVIDGSKQAVCVETSFTKHGVKITLSQENTDG